jgi:MFS family permease
MLLSLQALQLEFATSSVMATAVVATNSLALGLFSLLWGPASDVSGRKVVYLASTLMYTAFDENGIRATLLHGSCPAGLW